MEILSAAISVPTLVEAAEVSGGVNALARRLRVPSKQLGSWMEGEVETPRSVLLRALNLVRDEAAGSE